MGTGRGTLWCWAERQRLDELVEEEEEEDVLNCVLVVLDRAGLEEELDELSC